MKKGISKKPIPLHAADPSWAGNESSFGKTSLPVTIADCLLLYSQKSTTFWNSRQN